MKKYSLLLLLLLPILVFSQSEDEIKPVGGQKTLELQFSPFGDNPIDINGIRIRWFSSEQRAFRLNAFLGVTSNSFITQQEDPDNNDEELRESFTTIIFNIRPGIERHLSGTERLSPYFGFEGDLALQLTSFKDEFENGADVEYNKTINGNGFFRIGANLIAGFDYYVAKKLYLGTELGFGFSLTNELATKLKSNTTGFTEPEPIKGDRSFNLGPNVNAQIRLGYAF